MKLIKVLMAVAICAASSLTSCATSESTDAELRNAETAVTIAKAGLAAAEFAWAAKLADPKTSPAERAAASVILNEARTRLNDEENRLAVIRASRKGPVSALLPPPAEEVQAPVTRLHWLKPWR